MALLGRRSQRDTHPVIGKLIEAGFTPLEALDMTVEVNVIRSSVVTVVADPALIPIFARAPAHQGAFSNPGIVIVR